MNQNIRIRDVTVELLRSGPSHNQLLSPLTLYLGICGEAEAGLVSLPFEHHRFLSRVAVLRYDGNKTGDKLPEVRELGVEMAKVLGSIPRLPGALSADSAGSDTLVHLRLVLTAAELALLPFELAKVPLGPTQCAEGWLALQSRVPVVMTRRTRNVSSRDFQWLKEPRILFVAANHGGKALDAVPFDAHRAVLIQAVRPFLFPEERDPAITRRDPEKVSRAKDNVKREQFGDRLTILVQPTVSELMAECRRHRYTHVHILAHGDTDGKLGDRSFGLRLHPDDEVISGERLASALSFMGEGHIHIPDVVTLCTCDSGNNASAVVTPGASIAHVLHQAGVPLVLASQFPLSKEGSVLMTHEFYRGLLWGEHPWVLLHRVRMALHSVQDPADHDWASLVVYEALDLDTYKLDQGRYGQCYQAMLAAWLDSDGVEDDFDAGLHAELPKGLEGTITAGQRKDRGVIERLPVDSKFFGMRAIALRADIHLQTAIDCLHDEDKKRKRYDPEGEYAARVAKSCRWMEEAIGDYEAAVSGFLVKDGQGMNAPYRALVALLRLRAVLGQRNPDGVWEMTQYWVDETLKGAIHDDEERAWALASRCELHLLRTLDPDMAVRRGADQDALAAAAQLMRLDRAGTSLARRRLVVQLQTFIKFWGDPRFEEEVRNFGDAGRVSFSEGEFNLVETARALLDVLDKTTRRERVSRPLEWMPETSDDEDDDAAKDAGPDLPRWKAPTPRAPFPASTPAPSRRAAAAPSDTQGLLRGTTPEAGFIHVEMLPARHGDCLWIEYGAPGSVTSRVLVDCGPASNYAQLRARIEQLPKDQRDFDLFILSHIDDDHIGGALQLLQEAEELGVSFDDVWFNGWRHIADQLNAAQGEAFSALLERGKHPWNVATDGLAMVRDENHVPTFKLPGGMRITLLSPTPARLKALARTWKQQVGEAAGTPEAAGRYLGKVPSTSEDVEQLAAAPFDSDDTAPNGSSIAVLAEYGGHTLLLGADAYAPVLQQAVDLLCEQRGVARLKLDAFKLPHHGSRNNLSNELLQRLDCSHFLVSTSGERFNHPDREAVARCIQRCRDGREPATLWFNHRSEEPLNAVWDKPELKERYGYRAVYPADGGSGLRFTLPLAR